MSAQPRPAAHTVARGHVRLDRPTIVPNDPAPDPLDGLVFRIFSYQVEILILLALKDAYGCIFSYQDLAVVAWGDTPEVRADSADPQTRRVLRHHLMNINKRLAKHGEPFVIANERGKGYRLADRADATIQRCRYYTTADRKRIVAEVARLRAEHPEWTKEAVCETAGVCRQSYNAWRVRYPELFEQPT